MQNGGIGERELAGWILTRLLFHFRKVHRPSIDADRCTCLEFLRYDSAFLQLVGKGI